MSIRVPFRRPRPRPSSSCSIRFAICSQISNVQISNLKSPSHSSINPPIHQSINPSPLAPFRFAICYLLSAIRPSSSHRIAARRAAAHHSATHSSIHPPIHQSINPSALALASPRETRPRCLTGVREIRRQFPFAHSALRTPHSTFGSHPFFHDFCHPRRFFLDSRHPLIQLSTNPIIPSVSINPPIHQSINPSALALASPRE